MDFLIKKIDCNFPFFKKGILKRVDDFFQNQIFCQSIFSHNGLWHVKEVVY